MIAPSIGAGNTRRESVLGWLAVALITLISSFFALFAGGETANEGLMGLGHVVQMAVVVIPGVVAVTFRRSGGMFAVIGVFSIVFFGFLQPISYILGIPLITAGVLFYFGHPQPKKLAYLVLVGVPLLVGLATAIGALLAGPRPI